MYNSVQRLHVALTTFTRCNNDPLPYVILLSTPSFQSILDGLVLMSVSLTRISVLFSEVFPYNFLLPYTLKFSCYETFV